MLITLARTRCYQACSAVFILDSKGKLLISRNYRGDIPMSVAEKFANRVMEEVSCITRACINISPPHTSLLSCCSLCVANAPRLEQDDSDAKPVFVEDGVTFAYVKYNGLFRT
jgi:hypothetical protein